LKREEVSACGHEELPWVNSALERDGELVSAAAAATVTPTRDGDHVSGEMQGNHIAMTQGRCWKKIRPDWRS
jgi:hypothetical protein